MRQFAVYLGILADPGFPAQTDPKALAAFRARIVLVAFLVAVAVFTVVDLVAGAGAGAAAGAGTLIVLVVAGMSLLRRTHRERT